MCFWELWKVCRLKKVGAAAKLMPAPPAPAQLEVSDTLTSISSRRQAHAGSSILNANPFARHRSSWRKWISDRFALSPGVWIGYVHKGRGWKHICFLASSENTRLLANSICSEANMQKLSTKSFSDEAFFTRVDFWAVPRRLCLYTKICRWSAPSKNHQDRQILPASTRNGTPL